MKNKLSFKDFIKVASQKKGLLKKVLEASNEIHKNKLNGSSNYMITTKEIANIIKEETDKINKKQTRIKKLKRILNENNSDNNSNIIY